VLYRLCSVLLLNRHSHGAVQTLFFQIGIITETSSGDLPNASQGIIENPVYGGSIYAVTSHTPNDETNYAALFSAHSSNSRQAQPAYASAKDSRS